MKICVVSSSGGHMTESIFLIEAFKEHEIFFCTYHSPMDSDVRSIAPVYYYNNHFTQNNLVNTYYMFFMLFWALKIIAIEKPEVIVSFGAEIALPFFYLAKLFRIKTVFIETWNRIEDLSLTGRLVLPVADVFIVQWPQLLEKYGGKIQFYGGLI